LRRGEEWVAIDDAVVSPTYVPDLVDTSLDLLIDGEHGIWNLANQGSVTWYELASRAAALAGLDPTRITPRHEKEFGLPAARPRMSALTSRKASIMPTLDHALVKFLEESGWKQQADELEPALASQLGA
jgi:dTDP-4-dehydrorhamnose reductase